MDQEILFTRIIRRVLAGKMTVERAVDRLLYEVGHGGITLLVDETSYGLVAEFKSMNYTVYPVDPGIDDLAIKRQIRGRVLITRNGKHFSVLKDREHYDYGLVWVTSTGNDAAVAKKIEKVLMRSNFARNPHQVFKV